MLRERRMHRLEFPLKTQQNLMHLVLVQVSERFPKICHFNILIDMTIDSSLTIKQQKSESQ